MTTVPSHLTALRIFFPHPRPVYALRFTLFFELVVPKSPLSNHLCPINTLLSSLLTCFACFPSTGKFYESTMTRYSGRRQKPHDYDEPYNPFPRPRDGSSMPTTVQHEARGWWVGGEWIEPPRPQRSYTRGQSSRVSPIVIEDDADSDCYEVPPPAPQGVKAHQGMRIDPAVGASQGHFDFNDNEHALPWASRPDVSRREVSLLNARS